MVLSLVERIYEVDLLALGKAKSIFVLFDGVVILVLCQLETLYQTLLAVESGSPTDR